MISEVFFPRFSSDWHFSFEEVTRRHGDFAIAGLAAGFRIADRTIGECCLVFFGVADRPVRSHKAEAALAGKGLQDLPPEHALGDIEVLGSNEYSAGYKRHLMTVLLRRAVATLNSTSQ
jgi:carbon-monoxide dehydrogenase medium subunit